MKQADAGVTAPKLRTWWLRLLDGNHVWGSFDAMLGRYGLRRYRVMVFSPGIGAAERRFVRAWRGWPLGGAVLAFIAAMVLSDSVLTPTTTLLVCVGTYVAVGAALFAVSATARAELRALSVILIDGYSDAHSAALYREWDAVVQMLTTADERRAGGELSPVEYEAVWWEAYNRLEVGTRV